MSGIISSQGVVDGQIVFAEHVLRIVRALSAVTQSAILLNGELYSTGSNTFFGTSSFYGDSLKVSSSFYILPTALTSTPAVTRVLVQDPTTGLISYRDSSTISGNTGSFSGSFSGSFFGDGSGLTGIVSSKWTGSGDISRFGNVRITGSLLVSGGNVDFINASSITGSSFKIIGPGLSTNITFEVDNNLVAAKFKILDSGAIIITNSVTGSIFSASQFTGSFFGTASNAISSSYSDTAVSASYSITSSVSINSNTASFISLARSASYVLNAQSASISISSSFSETARSSSFSEIARSSSFSETARSSSYSITSSIAIFANSASQVVNDNLTGSFWAVGGNTFTGINSQSMGTLSTQSISIIVSGTQQVVFTNGAITTNSNLNINNLALVGTASSTAIYFKPNQIDFAPSNIIVSTISSSGTQLRFGSSTLAFRSNTATFTDTGANPLVSVSSSTMLTFITNGVSTSSLSQLHQGPQIYLQGRYYDGTSSLSRGFFIQGVASTTINQSGRLAFVSTVSDGNLTEIMSIGSSGRIGINTTSPTSLLHIRGVGTTNGMAFEIDDSAQNDRFVVLDTGSIGINKTTPTASLHLVSRGTSNAVAFEIDNSSNVVRYQVLDNGNVFTSGSSTVRGVRLALSGSTSASTGIIALASGAATVSSSIITANTNIFFSINNIGVLANSGAPYEDRSLRSPGNSFTIKSLNILDTDGVAWFLVEPST